MNKKQLTIMALVLAISIPLNVLAGTTLGTNLIVGDGTPDVTQNGEDAYIEGTFEVDGVSRFDGATTFNSTLTVGADDTGYDVTFYGATASSNLLWDESADQLDFNDSTLRMISNDAGANGATQTFYHDSASPAQLDLIGRILFKGKDDGDNDEDYSILSAIVADTTDGSEAGGFAFDVADGAGGEVRALLLTSTATSTNISAGEDVDITLEPDADGAVVIDGAYATPYDTVVGPGEISLNKRVTTIQTTGVDAFTLADGLYDGQTIDIACTSYVGNGTLTPDSTIGFTNVTFTGAGQSVSLFWFEGSGWAVVDTYGATVT